jgi:hypothetical protein
MAVNFWGRSGHPPQRAPNAVSSSASQPIWTPKIYLHNVVFVSLIGNPKICGTDFVEAMLNVEVDCPINPERVFAASRGNRPKASQSYLH